MNFCLLETLAAGGRAETNGLVAENVYMPINGTYMIMPKYECDAPTIGFTRGGCFNTMGKVFWFLKKVLHLEVKC